MKLGSKLLVNVYVPHGELHVEVLDGDGNVATRSEALKGDLLESCSAGILAKGDWK